jgi:biotin transport system permease protein
MLLGFSAVLPLGIPAMAAVTVLLAAGALSAGIRPRETFSGSRQLVVMLLLILLLQSTALALPWGNGEPGPGAFRVSFNREGFFRGLRFSWGILLSFSAASLFFSVTTMSQLKRSLDLAESFIRGPLRTIRGGGARRGRISLGLTLMLGFLPRFFELWEAADLACEARAGRRGPGRIITILPLVCERIIQSAAESAAALEARGLEL